MKKRARGVDRFLKARQNLKNIAKALDIPLDDIFAEAAELRRKAEKPKYEEGYPFAEAAKAINQHVNSIASAGPEILAATLQPPPTSVPGAPTNIFNEPVEIPQEQPRSGDHADGVRIAEADPQVPAGTPYYLDRCTGCNGEMYTRSKREDVCQTCAIVLRDEAVDGIRRMETMAGGRLVNPFSEE